jgi:GNAT superfamily N-acetyltransferase
MAVLTAIRSGRRGEPHVYRERPVPYLWLACCGGVFVAALVLGLMSWPAPVVAVVTVVVALVAVIGALRYALSNTIVLTSATLAIGGLQVPRDSIEGLSRQSRNAGELALACADNSTITIKTRHGERLKAALDLSDAMPAIRIADPDEYPKLLEIEQRADVLYAVADLGPLPDPATSHELIDEALVVLAAGRPALGFVRLDLVDGQAHLEQLSVVPSQMRRGIGTALLEAATAWAHEHGYAAMSVTTFEDVEWNAPFFARRGFTVSTDIGPELAELCDWENDLGLNRIGSRVVMRRDLSVPALADLTR